MKSKKVFLILTIATLMCNLPSKDFIISEYEKKYPNRSVVEISADEGDSDNIYYLIVYKPGNSNNILFDKVLLQKNLNDGNWYIKYISNT